MFNKIRQAVAMLLHKTAPRDLSSHKEMTGESDEKRTMTLGGFFMRNPKGSYYTGRSKAFKRNQRLERKLSRRRRMKPQAR